MKLHDVRLATVVLTMLTAVGCGSGTTVTSAPRSSPQAAARPSQAAASAGSGALSAASLCSAVSPELASAALGGPVDAPQSGDVLPRPNGVYCHYSATGHAETNVEAQLNDMTRTQFEQLAATLGATTPLTTVGDAAFRRDGSSMGGGGSTIVAWQNGRGVAVIINREGGDQAAVHAAAEAVTRAALALGS